MLLLVLLILVLLLLILLFSIIAWSGSRPGRHVESHLFRDFKDTAFTFLRIVWRLFGRCMVEEELCLFLRIWAP